MLGVCYYPEQWPETIWADDARRMAGLGLSFVRIGEFAWSRMEPQPGRLEFGWLDRAVDTLGSAGLKVVLGTPTATPPKWLADRHPEIVMVDEEGRRRRHGGRRHADLSSQLYWAESRRIVEALARRYGGNAHVAGWQVDNEFGCHGSTLSYSEAATLGFRRWLEARYGTVERLNQAWGAVFWSMEVRSFEEVEAPNLVVADAAPCHLLDFQRYSSAQVAAFGAMQAEVIRAHSPGRFVTTNTMSLFFDIDPFETSEVYDLASWDSYPLGHTDQLGLPDDVARRYARTGHPDVPGFNNDLYRAVGRGRFWIMEQQPGPVNWAEHNPAPLPGMVRLWTWQALAQGAEVVSYFRWRQVPYAQEQMHAGLNRPDNVLDRGGEEAGQVAQELATLARAGVALDPPSPAPVALVFSVETEWMMRALSQSHEMSYRDIVWGWYAALRAMGLDVDVMREGDDLSAHRLVVVPTLGVMRDATVEALRGAGGPVLVGPRSGWKTEDFAIPPELPPGRLQALLPLKVARVETLRPDMPMGVTGAVTGSVRLWRETVETDLAPLARFEDGTGALFAAGRFHYLAGVPDADLLEATLRHLVREAGLTALDLPEGIRVQRRGGLTFAFNFGPRAVDTPAPAGAGYVLGGGRLDPQDLAAWRTP